MVIMQMLMLGGGEVEVRRRMVGRGGKSSEMSELGGFLYVSRKTSGAGAVIHTASKYLLRSVVFTCSHLHISSTMWYFVTEFGGRERTYFSSRSHCMPTSDG